MFIKAHSSESRGQGGSNKRCPNGLETCTCEYFTGTKALKIKIPQLRSLKRLLSTFTSVNKQS